MKKWTVAAFQAAKGKRKLGCCTAYDACFAHLADAAGIPCILVGDSMGMTMLGYGTTLPVKMEETLSATAAVARAVKDALVVGDMPFGSYQCGDDEAVRRALKQVVPTYRSPEEVNANADQAAEMREMATV